MLADSPRISAHHRVTGKLKEVVMKLKELVDLTALYKRSRRQPNKLLFTWKNARRLWPMWAVAVSTLPLIALSALGIKYPIFVPISYAGLAVWTGGLFFTRLNALRRVYPAQFAEHAIGQQPWGEQENILCYAFFLQIVQDEGYTAAKLRELSAYSDLTVAPAKPALSQNLVFVSLFALMIGLSTELIKATSFFIGGKGAAILILVAAVSFIYWIVWDGIQSTPYQRLRIKRYVDLAAYDLEEAVQDVRELNPVESSPVLSMSKQTEPTA
ncbi:hypothetical protein ABFV57_14305 [Pseudomonas neuropathica]|uniref:hypothetical protein n=1 Tax=Pseudomonas neuropathica TaxID=2730425 RepID=UPI0034D67DFD